MKSSTRRKVVLFSLFIFIVPELLLLSSPILVYFLPLFPQKMVMVFSISAMGLALSLFLWSFFWGRMYCGHLCPVTGLFSLLELFQKKPTSPEKKAWEFPQWYGYLMFLLWLMAFLYMILRWVGNHYGFLPHIEVFSLWPIPLYYSLFLVSVILSRTFAKTEKAHYNCPLGPLMITSMRLSYKWKVPGLRFQIHKSSCTSCGLCTKNCLSQRDVEKEIQEDSFQWENCIQCGTCAEKCPSGVLVRKWCSAH